MRSLLDAALLALDIVMVVAGQFVMKLGVAQVGRFGEMSTAGFLVKTLLNPWVLLGIALYGLSAIVWLGLISRVPLSVAYPMLSLAYVLVVFVSWLFLGEGMTALKWLGVFLIAIGVVLINR